MPIIECEQGSPEWLQCRVGRITASRMRDMLNFLKNGGEGAKRRDYRLDLMAERMTGLVEDNFISREMLWGTENEPFARTAYEMAMDTTTQKAGFIVHPRMDYFGCSPDWLINSDGCGELKCPKTTTHIQWMMAGTVPEEHQEQCLAVMACSERDWCDFSSYDPRMPPEYRLFTCRMDRDERRIREMEAEVERFNADINRSIDQLRNPQSLAELLKRSINA